VTSYGECFAAAVSAAMDGHTVLTGNTRAARAVTAAAEARFRLASSAWATPDVLPFMAFVSRLHSSALVAGEVKAFPLGHEQELQLWRQVIERSASGRELLLPEAAAALASESLRTAVEYGIALDSAQMSASSETRAFSGWAAEFARQLNAHGWTCDALLTTEILPCLAQLKLPDEISVFLPELTPAQRKLLDALSAAGVRICISPEYDEETCAAVRREFDGEGAEMLAAAQWARQQLEANPDARVGVIFFDLERRRAAVESAFRAVLHPEHLLGERGQAAYEIASALPLAEYPALLCALRWLALPVRPLEFQEFAALLTSPYMPDAVQSAASFVRRVRKQARRQVCFEELAGWLQEYPEAMPGLRAAVERLPRHAAFDSLQTAGTWVEFARQMLNALGWTSAVKLTSEEFQSTTSWRELLSALASLDVLGWRGNYAGFVQQLERAVASQRFKPETMGAPVQIMDAAEAEGSVFDVLWIGSATDELWPNLRPAPPLIAYALLKDAGYALPGTPQAEASIWHTTQRLLHSAPQVVLSLARRTDDEREQRWSPAFAAVPLATDSTPSVISLALRFAAAELESMADARAPALGEAETARGGTGLLQDQSNCPFRAFAVRRLLAPQPEGPNEELAPTDRGKVVERALQLIWDELQYSEELRRPDLAAIVERAVDCAMAELLPPRSDLWNRRFRALERKRTIETLAEWLALEAGRTPFQVLGHQVDVHLTLGGLPLSGRIDRLDEVDGRTLVLDYKTGSQTSVSSWQVPRPRMPQLPFYAVAEQIERGNVGGVAFAVVRPGEAAFKSFLRDRPLLPGSPSRTFAKADFNEYCAQWAAELERIAMGFVQGDAAVDPKIAPGLSNSPCERCHLASLCRIGDAVGEYDDDGNGGGDE
jgi:probable DNA repair protein